MFAQGPSLLDVHNRRERQKKKLDQERTAKAGERKGTPLHIPSSKVGSKATASSSSSSSSSTSSQLSTVVEGVPSTKKNGVTGSTGKWQKPKNFVLQKSGRKTTQPAPFALSSTNQQQNKSAVPGHLKVSANLQNAMLFSPNLRKQMSKVGMGKGKASGGAKGTKGTKRTFAGRENQIGVSKFSASKKAARTEAARTARTNGGEMAVRGGPGRF